MSMEREEIIRRIENHNILILPIEGKWLDMILKGEKKEEYREIKKYYQTRFENIGLLDAYGLPRLGTKEVVFRNGYSKQSRQVAAVVSMDIKEGREEWGAQKGIEYYTLKIHEVMELGRM